MTVSRLHAACRRASIAAPRRTWLAQANANPQRMEELTQLLASILPQSALRDFSLLSQVHVGQAAGDVATAEARPPLPA